MAHHLPCQNQKRLSTIDASWWCCPHSLSRKLWLVRSWPMLTPEPVHLLQPYKSEACPLVQVTVALAGASQIRAEILTLTFSPLYSKLASYNSTASVMKVVKSTLELCALEYAWNTPISKGGESGKEGMKPTMAVNWLVELLCNFRSSIPTKIGKTPRIVCPTLNISKTFTNPFRIPKCL